MTRKYNSEIVISENDKWIFRDQEITQTEILKFFRRNLDEDEKGIFIRNSFRELSEEGYVDVQGFPLHVRHITEEKGELLLETDADEKLSFTNCSFYTTPQGELFVIKNGQQKIKYRLSRQAATCLGGYLSEENKQIHLLWNGITQKVEPYPSRLDVPLPE